jgi:hypothetical protein
MPFLEGINMTKVKSIINELELAIVGPFREDATIEAEEVQERRREKVETNTASLESLPSTKGNGNGTKPASLWEVVTATSTFETPSEREYAPILEELAEARQKLWETEKEKQRLQEFYEHWLSNQYDSEALATSDEDAMVILSRFASCEALHMFDLIKADESKQWLSLIRLVQANFVSYLGSYLYITDRGKKVMDAVLNHKVVEGSD